MARNEMRFGISSPEWASRHREKETKDMVRGG